MEGCVFLHPKWGLLLWCLICWLPSGGLAQDVQAMPSLFDGEQAEVVNEVTARIGKKQSRLSEII